MKYLFCGYMFPDVESDIKKMKVPPTVSAHKFQINMMKGLIENKQEVYVINIPRYRYYPHLRKIIVKGNDFVLDSRKYGQNIGFVNLPVLNYITQYFAFQKSIKRYLEKYPDEFVTLICFNNNFPRDKAAVKIKMKNKQVIICNVIGDLYGKYGVYSDERYHGIKGKIITCIEKEDDKLHRKGDTFAFLTEYMADALGVEQKPFVVVEGLFADQMEKTDFVDDNEKIIFYAGNIGLQYDIQHLLDAFEMIKGNEYKLFIAGRGDAEDMVKEYAARDGRIEYLGFVTPKEVAGYQKRATILINPRTSGHEYVKYSFPSKNMECLASGKPYIAHKLVCNPEEYGSYIQYPKDESDEALAEKIIEICNMSPEERNAIGERARKFILEEKNPQKQMLKIVRMNEKVCGANQ